MHIIWRILTAKIGVFPERVVSLSVNMMECKIKKVTPYPANGCK